MSNINGPDKNDLEVLYYDIDAAIDNEGNLKATVTMTAKVLSSTAQFMAMALHHDIEIESIKTADGQLVEFLRENREMLYSQLMLVMLPEPPTAGDSLILNFKYEGEVAERKHGLFFVDASWVWYPRYGSHRSEYDIRFKSPIEFDLIASAALIDSSSIADTLYTHWRTECPEEGVTFNIAVFEKVTIDNDDLPDIELYLNRPLHKDQMFLSDYRDDWYKDVAPSVQNSMNFFSEVYGKPIRQTFRVTEMLNHRGTAYPGFINLSYRSYMTRDVWGEELIFRSHEVAHQWWGISVSPETYHDQWLPEGLASYSSLRYCNTVNHDVFMTQLRQYRNNIFQMRHDWFYKGKEAGPIIQGRRTSSSKTKGDFQLIIYQKAAMVLHMLRCHLTDWTTMNSNRFNNLLEAFYRKYAGGNASTNDFKELLEEQTGTDWTWFFDQWIYGSELPEYKFSKKLEFSKTESLWVADCLIIQKEVGPDFKVIMPIEIEFDDGEKQYTTVVVNKPETKITLRFDSKPRHINLNPLEAVLCKVDQ